MSTVPHSNRTVIALIGAVALLVVIAVVVVFSQGAPEQRDADSPEGVVQRYASSVIAGDEDQALEYLVPELREACDRSPTTPVPSMRISLVDTTVRADSADVRVSLVTSYADGGPFGASEYQSDEVFDLDRVEGDWLIRSVPWPLRICTNPPVLQ